LFSSAFNTPAFNYSTSPSHTELENVVINWCHGALGLPEKFKNNNSGGGVISSSSSNSVFLAVHAAKKRKLK
jgi:glutamate/tyrosine decarboxylase-like PLP-dependent enzyme